MADNPNRNLFGRLTKLFRSGPIIRRRVKGMGQKTGSVSTALEVFKAAHSDVYNSTLSAYGAYDRMSRYSDFSEMEACIAGDTLIATPNGYVEIQELAKQYGPDETFIVYAYDHEKKQIVPALGKQARKTVTAMSYKVTFDSGKVLIATPDHRVMRRDGTYCEVQDLKTGDSMMPFYRRDLFANDSEKQTSEGYRWIYTMGYENSTVKNGWVAEHKLIAEWAAERKVDQDEVVHHINFKKYDNRPENLQIMLAEDHRNYHSKIINGKKWSESNSKWIENFKKKHSEFMKERNPAKRLDITFAKILQVCDRDGFNLYNVAKVLDCSLNVISHRLRENGFRSFETFANAYDSNWKNNGWDNRGEKNPRFDNTLTFQHVCDAFSGQSSKKLAEQLGTTQIKVLNRVKSVGYKSWSDFKENFTNHKVVSVEPYKVIDLYDLTVDGYKNYATDSIIVHNTPEIASALDIYAEETVSPGADGNVLHIYSDNRKIQDLLENLFYDTLNIEFNLVMWVRNLVKYGDFFLFNDISPEFGVINVIPISISEIEREEGFDPKDPMAVRFRWITQGNQMLENWQISHFRLLGNDAFLPYGSSVLEAARRIWRQLILIEDAMLVYRVIRAPERRVFYIDVGNVPPEEVANYLEQAQTSLKRNPIVDKASGKMDLRYNPMAVDQDYFLPVRGGETGTKIDTLAGGQNTAAIEDVQYIQKKLFAALKIPKAYLGYDEDTGCFTGDTRVSLLDGREVEIERLVEEYKTGKQNWVYSFDASGKPRVGKVLNAWETKQVNELYVVSLDNGEEIRCTGNHRFMMRDGTYIRADELTPGASCMALYRSVSDKKEGDFATGYEKVYDHQDASWIYTHRLVASECPPRQDSSVLEERASVIHHASYDKRNNNPDQLLLIGKKSHVKHHQEHANVLNESWCRDRLRSSIAASSSNRREFHSKNFMSRSGFENYLRRQGKNPTEWYDGHIGVKNHKVLSVSVIVFEEPVPVYDLEIEKWSNFSLSTGVVVHNSKATLAQEDIRFSRSISRIQKTVLSELNKLAMVHLYSHGYEGDDLMDFTLKLSNPSSIAVQQKLELIKTKFEIAGTAPEGLVSRRWIRKNILELTDQEIEDLKEEKSDDKLEDAAVEAAASKDSGGGESGGEASGEEAGGEEEGGGLFSGDEPKGSLLTATPGRKISDSREDENYDEEDEEQDISSKLSIDDPDAPLKAQSRIEKSTQSLNMFGEPIPRSRKVTDGPGTTHMPNFAKMTGLGTTQGSLRNPYDKSWMLGMGEVSSKTSAPNARVNHRSKMTHDVKNTLDKYNTSVRSSKQSILKEENVAEGSADQKLEIDLESLGRETPDE